MTTFGWTLIGWAVLALVGVAIEFRARRWHRGPTLSRTVRWATGSRVGRVLALLAWMWLGWHAFAR